MYQHENLKIPCDVTIYRCVPINTFHLASHIPFTSFAESQEFLRKKNHIFKRIHMLPSVNDARYVENADFVTKFADARSIDGVVYGVSCCTLST